jgi:hypothetical protein
MQPGDVFSVCNTTALIGWVVLLAGMRRPWGPAAARWLAVGFAVVYVVVLGLHFGAGEGGFDTLENVMKLFTNPWVALGGWVHYLAFDLFVGAWIAAEGQRRQLAVWRVLPCLPLTFLFGPAGLLLFTLLRGREE